MGIPLYVIFCFSLAAFNIFSLCLIFKIWLIFFSAFSPFGLSCLGLSVLPGLSGIFPFPFWEVFDYNLLKYFIIPFLFYFFFWDTYNSNVGAFNVVPEVSETVFHSFHSYVFILFCDSYFHHSIFQLTYPFFCFIYSAIDSF